MFCNAEGAELIISPFTYNKNAFENTQKTDESLWYDPKVKPYLLAESVRVAEGLVFCGELNILPTAVNPTSSLENYSRTSSSIIPHAKMAMVSVPRMPDELPRFLYTTGTCTLRNYIQKKAGQKAEFHHVFGALYVEIDDKGDWWVRQLIAAKDGSFYDLDHLYDYSGVSYSPRVEALTYGDIHIEKLDPSVKACTWDAPDSMLEVLKPKYQFVHDLIDFTARSHHNINDPFFLVDRHFNGDNNVEEAMVQAGMFLKSISRPDTTTVVVESNHHMHMNRWLKEAKISTDPENALFYHELCAESIKAIIAKDERFSPFEYAVRRHVHIDRVKFLREDDSYVIAGDIECGLHGHLGPNGSRGSPRNLRGIGHKANTGHTHSAGIVDGVYTSGVSAQLKLGYNKGPTSWSHSHIITYPNGKRTIVTIKNNKWRA